MVPVFFHTNLQRGTPPTTDDSNASRPANATGNNTSIYHQRIKRLSSGRRDGEQRQRLNRISSGQCGEEQRQAQPLSLPSARQFSTLPKFRCPRVSPRCPRNSGCVCAVSRVGKKCPVVNLKLEPPLVSCLANERKDFWARPSGTFDPKTVSEYLRKVVLLFALVEKNDAVSFHEFDMVLCQSN